MTEIIGFAGTARAGKDSSLKLFYAGVLKDRGVIDRYEINDAGDLLVNAAFEHGEEMGVLDISRRDEPFVNYAYQMIWPHVKDYHFADNLKIVCSKMFGLTYEQMFGTVEQKTSNTKYLWKEFINAIPKAYKPKLSEKGEYVTARELMQYVGDILRSVDDDCFTNSALNEIELEQVPIALIGDVRRINEVNAIKERGGKVILLKRKTHDMTHRIENEFEGIDESIFDYIVDNQDLDMKTKNLEILRIGRELGILQ